jgi:hypothetical protein
MKSGLVLLFLTVCFASTAQAQNHKKLIYSRGDTRKNSHLYT